MLQALPDAALKSEAAFRDYVTSGTHRETAFTPAVADLTAKALHDLWDFIAKAHFDMDATSFDAFNRAWFTLHTPHSSDGYAVKTKSR